jgi:DNA replication protein DnaC
VIDDIGMLPAGQDAAEAFYRVVDAAYEHRSLAVTSNIHPSGFDTLMPKTLATATATVDRLLHHACLVQTSGD